MLAILDVALHAEGEVGAAFITLPAMRTLYLDQRIQWPLTCILPGFENWLQTIELVNMGRVHAQGRTEQQLGLGRGSGGLASHQKDLATAR